MSLSPEQQKRILYGAVAVLAILVLYRFVTAEKPRTVPLTYTQGAVARSRVRTGIAVPAASDPLRLFLARRMERFPGVSRDIFRMDNPAPKKPKAIFTAPTPTIVIPVIPEKTPEQIAAEAARADLSKFRFLGYLTDTDSSLFLSKDGETFIVKSGDPVLKNYRVKDAGKDYVVLLDTVTQVEVKVELSGGAEPASQSPGLAVPPEAAIIIRRNDEKDPSVGHGRPAGAYLAGCAGSRAFQRGESYSQHGEWDLAVKEYREANKSDPKNIEYRSALMRAEETAANQHYKKARAFLKERKLDQAILELQQALFLNPSNAAIQSALKSVLDMKQAEEHYRASLTFLELTRLNDAVNELNQAVELDPENAKYHDALDKVQKKKTETEPDDALTLASDKPITLNFKNTNIKEVFELLAKLSGINIMFDEEVKAQPVTVFVKDVSFQYALNLLLSTNKLFMKKISADTIIIIPKNKSKLDQYQDLMVQDLLHQQRQVQGDREPAAVHARCQEAVRQRGPELHHHPRYTGEDQARRKDHHRQRSEGSRSHPRRRDPRDLAEQRLEVRLEFHTRRVSASASLAATGTRPRLLPWHSSAIGRTKT